MSENFDIAVIGAGPGGYVAAIRAAQLGFRTVCIDQNIGKDGTPSLGGTCLNTGCIPSKALLQSSEYIHALQYESASHGVTIKNVTFDPVQMIERKDSIVRKLTSGIEFLFKKNKITRIFGTAHLTGQTGELWDIHVSNSEKAETLQARHVILATGSRPRQIPGVSVDNISVLDNVGALDMNHIPKTLGIIGAGVIGLEMGSVWSRLSSKVTILEAMPVFLGAADRQTAREAQKTLTKDLGWAIELGVQIKEIKKTPENVTVNYEYEGQEKTLSVEKLIVSVGRVPNVEGLGASEIGLEMDRNGFITVDEDCRTNLPNIWAIGDVVRGPMLAHKASEEGVAVAERIAGQKPHVDLGTIPFVIYTSPEIAWVGKTEEQLQNEGLEYRKGTSSFMANGRSLSMGQTQGFVKILACSRTDRILGVHMVGPYVSELISEAVVAMEFKASSEDIARIVHAHPSLSEVVHEAALAVDKRPLHG